MPTPFGSPQVTLFANSYLTVAVTGKTPKSNQLETLWLSPFRGIGFLPWRSALNMRGERGWGVAAIKNRANFQTLPLRSSQKTQAFYYSCLMRTPPPACRARQGSSRSPGSVRQLPALASCCKFFVVFTHCIKARWVQVNEVSVFPQAPLPTLKP